ncbi:MAG: 2Fe-2S iron-sulfur cluster binding domain-containing protein, partial [Gammaproteobacteria bacterium]|nr:2Fe-2S iron-sulfur cluster binding domain-containing protein [Gammaproteobacteria bacterium]
MVGDRTIPPKGAKCITIHIMGQAYQVPETLTILKAIEFAGYRFKMGCGCRGGICGACGTFYRVHGDHQLYTGLACQTVVVDGMHLAQVPFFPSNRATHIDLGANMPPDELIASLYPEIFRCVACGTCTRTCPMGIDVMNYIAAFKRGDIMGGAERSFDCIMCGLCMVRCPASISQPGVALASRRLAATRLRPKSQVTRRRADQVRSGRYEPMLAELVATETKDL